MLEERGVTFYMNDAVAEVQGENRRVKSTGSFVLKINLFILSKNNTSALSFGS